MPWRKTAAQRRRAALQRERALAAAAAKMTGNDFLPL